MLTHSDGDVHGAVVGFPIKAKGHHSDPDRLSWAVVGLVRLNEGVEAFGVEGQLCRVGENLNVIHVTFDMEEVRASVAGLILLDLRVRTLDLIRCNKPVQQLRLNNCSPLA